ncbi:WD40/YVTN/BNR-like repeat-containing protein [Nocardioides caldifontis]|uniref:WD40/YVTN/BNR-like repeat-containing protein n=1 Tax=Nocardioides caldifontis TaxID=2588938 RepID=UPI0011E035E9|nr:hypothetical protein [Nocardioides caldifontis]
MSLTGRADFHSLEATEGRLYGYDATSSRLLTSTDRGRSWESLGRHDVLDLAADPRDPHRLLATNSTGTLTVLDAFGASAQSVDGAPPLALIDWPAADLLVGVDPGGVVYSSTDGGGSWDRTSNVPGAPHAIDVDEGAWLVATDRGIYRSEDDGRKWDPLLT